jgi:hypothetical protein
MKAKEMLVYSKDRKTVLTTVTNRVSSITAAKKAGVKSCRMLRVNGKYAWVEK